MPSKKTIVVFIICMGIIMSILLLTKNTPIKIIGENTNPVTDVSGSELNGNNQNDWQKILVGMDNGTTTVLTNQNTTTPYPNEGTQTDQMAKDFFAQYLLLKQGGTKVTPEQAAQIAQNTLSSPQYTKSVGVQYTADNLHIIQQTSKDVAKKYMDDGLAIFTKYSNQNYQNELTILNNAIKSGKDSDFAKLDPIIANYKGMISDSLEINVPKDAVELHLAILNSISNILANVEAMRVTLTDPVRSFAGVSQYKQHVLDIDAAMIKLTEYFKAKGVLP
jgi:hypothetical protein